jgi:hypothetical protein
MNKDEISDIGACLLARPAWIAALKTLLDSGTERSEAAQRCLPSTTGSASAAPQEQGDVKRKTAPVAKQHGDGKAEDEAGVDNSVVQLPVSEPSGTELLPCPFCGQQPVVKMAGRTNYWWVGCEIHLRIEAPGCGVSHSDYDRTMAIKKWNTRAGTKSEQPDGRPSAAGLSGGS